MVLISTILEKNKVEPEGIWCNRTLIEGHRGLARLLAEADSIISPIILLGLMSSAFHLTHQVLEANHS